MSKRRARWYGELPMHTCHVPASADRAWHDQTTGRHIPQISMTAPLSDSAESVSSSDKVNADAALIRGGHGHALGWRAAHPQQVSMIAQFFT